MANPFATAADLAAYSGGQIAADDARSQPALDAATEIVRGICGWHIAPLKTDDVAVLDGDRARILSLPTLHLVAVTQVKVDATVIAADTYSWSVIGELRRGESLWSNGFRSVEVTMNHGYATVPEPLKQLVLAMAARAVLAPAAGIVREQTLASSVTWAQTGSGVSGGVVLMAHEQAILAPYKIVTI